MALMSRETKRLRPRQAVLIAVLLACWAGLQSRPAAQSNDLAVLFSPGAGTFVGSETVTLRVQAGAAIHYTLDGSVPTGSSPTYAGPLNVAVSTTVRAIALRPDWGSSGVKTERYVIEPSRGQVVAGRGFSLAVDEAGRVWSWGANDDGQLGATGSARASRDRRRHPPAQPRTRAVRVGRPARGSGSADN